MSLETRFWSKVEKGNGCWPWMAALTKGYPQFHVSSMRERYGHRVAWRLTYGPIPSGLRVCHRCDNPRCVRPEHLFLATALENSRDMVAKGRSARGEKAASAKLTEADIRTIGHRHAAGESATSIARSFNIEFGTACQILRGDSWAHVGLDIKAIRAAHAKAHDHCPHGHPLSGDNLYVYAGTRQRKCRACERDRMRAKRLKLKTSVVCGPRERS